MNSEITLLVNTIQKELWLRWRLALILFVITAATFLTAAWVWPKIYTSSSVILVDQESILSPLMRGTAVETTVRDRSRIAQQTIFSQKAMDRVIASPSWAGADASNLSPKELDTLKNVIRGKTEVLNAGENLIEISFKDSDAEKAFRTAALLTDIFMQDSINAKQEESRSAYEFINEQVGIYQGKLRRAEEAIKEFRSKNVDATQGAKDNANARLVELKREFEGVELEISSEKSGILGNKKRLSGEVSPEANASFAKEGAIQARITELNTRLEDLRLNYKETYPDIVQIKGQVKFLQKALVAETLKRESATTKGTKNVPTGLVAQELKQGVLVSEAKIITLVGKKQQLQLLIDRERETLTDINAVEAEVAELNRDYTVNQNMYQSLLGQRENARVSMNIDIKNQGLTMKIQEPAILPVTPHGVRFAHIIMAGLIFSFVVPIGLVYVITLLDQKVRSELYLRDELRLPILASVYKIKNIAVKRQQVLKLASISFTILATWSVYGYVIVLRLQG